MPEKTVQKEPGKKPAPSKKPKPQQEVVVQIPLSELHPFPDHPFQVREDASMQETAESVKEYGVLVPALARPREDGGYELIAGHRRKHACELAGLATMPVIVRDIDRDTATIIMVDSNLQRENILPSERAKAYKMKMEAIKRQGARTDLTSPKISAKFRSDDEVGQDAGVSGDTIRNYIALTQLVPELQQMVDEKKIALSPAYQLAALTPKEQGLLLETIDSEQATPSLSQAQRMKKLSQSGELNEDTIRLPNNAFKANAGTDVVSDILFLQKRDRPIEIEPDWVHFSQNGDGFAINRYFVDHPEMILGRQTSESTQYGKQDFTVVPIEGLELADQLHDAVKNIRGAYQEAELPELGEGEQIDTSIPADPNVKNYSYTVVDGEVYYRENSRMVKPELNATAAERIKGMVALRDCVNELIALQMDEYSAESRIQEAQAELNRLYDAFSAKHGLINERANRLAFSDDSSYYLLCSLEVLDDDGKLERKADMFHKRTIKQQRSVDSVDTAKDDVIYFEQLGVDRMFVDESDNYKNLFLYTKMRNVAGLSTTDAQKSSDMFSKCRYMDELTGGRGVVFATGTPVSNSMTELYTIQRYLQHDRLQEMGMGHFDCWASRFGETTTALELAPEGTGYRARTRFAKFFNLPELMNLFKEVADIKTADQLHLPTPEVAYHTIATKPTQIQQDMVKALSERASKVHSGAVSPDVDNMLKITSDGRKLGLDQRIINPMLPDKETTKVNQCVANILQYWRDGEKQKLTQLVFCDISTPKTTPSHRAAKASPGTLDSPEIHALESAISLEESSDTPFTVYEDVRQKLIDAGMPPEQIAFIHDANTEVKKRELFAKVRSGQVRVLMGSTAKMGAGTNVQDRLVALHDLDCPWRPRDLTQRKGRIERQGNQNKLVHVCRYVTEGTFDAYLWQTVENKQKFISQIMTSKSPVRSCEDVDATALSFAEIKALCAGDPRIKERMDLDIEVSKLKIMKADHNSKQFRLEDSLLKYFPEKIEEHKGFVRGLEADMQTLAAHPLPAEGFFGMEIRGDRLTDKENAGAALLDTCKEVKGKDPVQIGSYRGSTMSVAFDSVWKTYTLTLKGQMTHRVELGSDTLRKRVKQQEKEIRRLKEENEFLAEASAFFAASRRKSAKGSE